MFTLLPDKLKQASTLKSCGKEQRILICAAHVAWVRTSGKAEMTLLFCLVPSTQGILSPFEPSRGLLHQVTKVINSAMFLLTRDFLAVCREACSLEELVQYPGAQEQHPSAGRNNESHTDCSLSSVFHCAFCTCLVHYTWVSLCTNFVKDAVVKDFSTT